MKYITGFVALLLITAIPALAIGPSPYVGVNLQSNSPTGDFKRSDFSNEEGGAKSALGGEVDFGVTGGMASAYVGYRFGKFDANTQAEIPGVGTIEAEGEWKVNRWVLGARWHLFGALPSPINPTIGGGVTIGKTTASAGGSSGGISYETDEDSKASVGWFLEGGAILKLVGNMSLIGDLQYHRFDAEYDTDIYDGTVQVSFFTLQLGARFALM
jgi:opacity protein-like surface antigen